MISKNRGSQGSKRINPFYKRSGLYVISIIILFIFIGILTTIKPAYRFSSDTITRWTSDIDSSTFLYLMGMENKIFQEAFPEEQQIPDLSTTFFQIAASIKPDDPRSLLGRELPGFASFGSHIIVAGEGANYTNLAMESSPPLEDVLEEREAVMDEPSEKSDKEKKESKQTTGERDVVFIYNSHSRESFLPHLPDVTDPDQAHHDEVNITKVSDKLAETLKENGIGTNVDHTDIMDILNERGWEYSQSYDASREVVEEAVSNNKDIQYAFDLHRDSSPGDQTTKEIDGKKYAQVLFVVGADYDDYEKNLSLATEVHEMIEEKYPGLSKGVITKEGASTNGVFNQDLSDNAMLMEFGGYDNTLEELYRTADVVGEVFSELYWDAEKVDAD